MVFVFANVLCLALYFEDVWLFFLRSKWPSDDILLVDIPLIKHGNEADEMDFSVKNLRRASNVDAVHIYSTIQYMYSLLKLIWVAK